MRRGDIWTASAGGTYAGKPRPVVIVQDDAFEDAASVTICAFTTDPTVAPLIRIVVEPDSANGLAEQCSLMIDKVTTIPKTKLGRKIGRLDEASLIKLNRALLVFLGLARPQRPTA
jgi:mRNA interferase MazF